MIKRTLLSANSYYYRRDGSEAVFLDHNELMEKNAWNVIPFAMKHPKNLDSKWKSFFVEEMEFGSRYSFSEKVKRIPKMIYSIEAKKKISLLIENTCPDIFHCHSIYHHISPSILSAVKKFDIPAVMTLHDLKIACPAYYMYTQNRVCEECNNGRTHRAFINRCIKNSFPFSFIVMIEALLNRYFGSYQNNIDVFVSPSRFYIEKLVEHGWDRSKFVHIPNPVDVERYEAHLREGGEYILYFGRLSVEKGLIILLQAAAREDIKIVLAGDGPQRKQLEIMAEELGVDAVFHGHLSVGDLEEVIDNAKVTVLPSLWYENAPMSILESYAKGKPVIGSRIGGIPELVVEGVTGRLFKSGSVSDLARLLRYFADLPQKDLLRYGRESRTFVEENYSSGLYLQRIQRLYDRLIEKKQVFTSMAMS